MEFEEQEFEVECGKCGTYIIGQVSYLDGQVSCTTIRTCHHFFTDEQVLELIVEEGLVAP
jgi:hypothetical protein